MAKLGEVCLLKAGKFVSANDISPEYNKGLYPCFGGNGIRGYIADYTHDGEFPLIGRQGALCGNVNLASGKFHATEHAVVVQPKIEMNVHWLYYALNAMNLGQYATGAAQPGLAVSKLETLSIEIPNISEQNKIAQTLYKVEQLVNFRKQQLAKLDELVKARFVEMFGNPSNNSLGFPYEPLSNCLLSIENGKSFVCSNDMRQEENPAILKLSAVTYGVYQQDENKAILDSSMFVKSAEVHKGDLLFTRKNTPELVGMCAYVNDTAPNLMMPDLIFRLNTNEKINKIFLWKLINHEFFRGKIQNIATGSAKSMSNISKERLEKLAIILPPLHLQNDFAALVERVDQQKQTIQQSLEKLELLKKALMQEYFG